jgi:heme exporter protein B
MSLAQRTLVVLRKDLLLQWRTRSRFAAVLAFGVTTLLLFSFAVGPDANALRQHAAGYLWLAVLMASTLSLSESFRLEIEHGAMDALRLLPADARALYYGKALANLAVLAALGILLLPFMAVLYGTTLAMGFPRLVGIVLLGAAGLSAPGTLYAALSARARSSDVLLPLLLFPLLVPAILASVKATALILEGDPMEQLGSWTSLLAAFDVVYWSLCGVLYTFVVED